MIETRNDLPRAAREKLIDLLNQRLADLTDLFSQTKQAHWNVKGPNFIALHELFDKAAEAVEDHIDDVAERLVQLGGVANGTIRMAAARSSLREYPANAIEGAAHVAALSDAFAATGKHIRAAIDSANELQDADTADLFTEISRSLDQYLWFIEAHGQAPR